MELLSEADGVVAEARRNRLNFIARELELAATFLQIATAEYEAGEKEAGASSLDDAFKACDVARASLAKLNGTDANVREALERRIEEIHAAIERRRLPSET